MTELVEGTGVSRPAVSRHLSLLLEAGVVAVEGRGRERWYSLDQEALAPALAWLTDLAPRPASAPVPEHALDALELEVRRTVRDTTRPTPQHDIHDMHEQDRRHQHTDTQEETA